MRRVSGLLMLLLVVLLVFLPAAAFGVMPDNGAPVLTIETKIGAEEEEVAAWSGEIVAAFAVAPSRTELSLLTTDAAASVGFVYRNVERISAGGDRLHAGYF